MNLHFIWFGSNPPQGLTAKIAAKMRYLNSMFNLVPNLTFYLWTMPNEMGVLTSKFAAEHLGNLHIKNIEDLFKQIRNPQHLTKDELKQLRALFLRESTGPISNKAVAADMIKFLTLLYFGGLYIDAGLDMLFDGSSGVQLSKKGMELYNKLKGYDYALTQLDNNCKAVDLQIMFFSQNQNAKEFLINTIRMVLKLYPNDTGKKYHYSKEYDDIREFKFEYQKFFPVKAASYTGNSFNAIYTSHRNHKLYYFIVDTYKDFRFNDFPEICIKNQKNQQYENYRTKIFIPQDETGYPSLVFPRKKQP